MTSWTSPSLTSSSYSNPSVTSTTWQSRTINGSAYTYNEADLTYNSDLWNGSTVYYNSSGEAPTWSSPSKS